MTSVFLAAATVALSVLAGCSLPGRNISQQGFVNVRRAPSEKITIPWADVYQEGQNLVVCGVVRQTSASTLPYMLHIDVAVLAADGKPLIQRASSDLYVPRHAVGKGPGFERFEVHLPFTPAPGATVELTCHLGAHQNDPYCQQG
jgi:hypothetical protein